MGRLLVRFVGIAFAGLMTASAVVNSNVIGAVFFGLITVCLVWFAIRRQDPEQEMHPLRALVGGAVVFTLFAAFAVAAAIEEQDRERGLALAMATLTVPMALGL